MEYKSTYFRLSLDNNLSLHKDLYNDWINRDKTLQEIKQLELLVEEDLKQIVESMKISERLPIKGQYEKDIFGKKNQKFKSNERLLNEEEKEELLNQYNLQDIMNWNSDARLHSTTRAINMLNFLLSKNVKKLKSQLEKLKETEFVNSRFTKIDEENLDQHLKSMGAEGWKLHSMNPIIRSLHDRNKSITEQSDFNINVTEGYILIWERV
jgi:hypothetical protein